MKKKMSLLVTGILIALLSLTSLVEAQSMKTNLPLTPKEQSIVTISAFTASGDLEKLKAALDEGLDAGLTISEIKEILVQLYAYTGFPRSLNGLATFMEVVKVREQKGLRDNPGREPTPLPPGQHSIEIGAENQTKLAGAPVKGPLFDFAPAIDTFLKAHLFGDIFARDNLDWQSREIATIAALANLEGLEGQLQAHFNIGMNTGLTPEALHDIVEVLKTRVSPEKGENAEALLKKVLLEKQTR